MLKVGITGGIGSGKSFIAKVFYELGASIYDADTFAKYLMQNNESVKEKIKLLLGDEAYRNDTINRHFIEQKIYGNKHLLTAVNNIIHPAVKQHFNEWCSEQSGKYVIKETAIMFESGANYGLDFIVTVSSPFELRKRRTLTREGMTEEKFNAIVKNQLTDVQRNTKANFVIENDDKQLLLPEILKLHDLFLAKCS